MKQLSAEECVARILKDIEKRKTVDRSDKNSVRRYDAAIKRISERANYILDNYPEKMKLIISLLDHPDYDIAGTMTFVLFELHHATKLHKLAAIESARRLECRDIDEFQKFIWAHNIEHWEARMKD